MAGETPTGSPLTPGWESWVWHRSRASPPWIASDQAFGLTPHIYLQWEGGCSMANSLLDFVMSLVRDPDAAAQYAANPAQAIADANLTDVTHVDVDNLIPVVAESMSTAVPSGGVPASADTLLDSAHNVWASGAATAAFDAFDAHLPI